MTPLDAFGTSVLFVHAHPDDESISTGGTIALLREAGADVLVVTATRGERGEVMPGPLEHLEGSPALVAVRESELESALAALGSPAQCFLGTAPARTKGLPQRQYSDSGMEWGTDGLAVPAAESAEDAFSLADENECLADLLAAVTMADPSAIVSYDERGGYGHPDHVRCHQLARAAAERVGIPFFALIEPRVTPPAEREPGPEITVALGSAFAAKRAAMAAHRTQLTVTADAFTLTGGQTHPIAREERYRRLR